MKIIFIVGARPNFVKIAPLIEQANLTEQIEPILLHTGQHYDDDLSKIFFDELELPKPHIYLGVGSASHAVQTATIMTEFEKVCLQENPDLVVVVGDVNSTLACSLVAAKMNIPLAHVEAGLRSWDRAMPEEKNRIVTDALSDFLFVTSPDAIENLRNEGVASEKIHFVGNVMIDTLLKFQQKAKEKSKININNAEYAFLTLHRPSNVDDQTTFQTVLNGLKKVSEKIPIIFAAHPRTQNQIKQFGFEQHFQYSELDDLQKLTKAIHITKPLPYLECLNLMANAKLVLTDSGGIQEETTILGVPCLTIRDNTERPITITQGTNKLVKRDPELMIKHATDVLENRWNKGAQPELWDGKTAQRIIKILLEMHANNN